VSLDTDTEPGLSLRMGPAPSSLQRELWRNVRWRPYPLQEEILLNRTRLQVLAAGRRAGKSQVGGHKLLPEAVRAESELDELRSARQRREFWIVGPEYSDAEKEFRVAYSGFERLGFKFDHPGTYNNPESGQMRISMFNGRFIIHAKSAKYPSTLVGEGLSGVIFSEAAKLKPSVWTKYIRPTLADFAGWAYFGSTPEGKNWFYDLWKVGQDPERQDWASWRAPAWVNPYVYPDSSDESAALLERLIEARRKGIFKQALATIQMITTVMGISPAGIHPEIWAMFLDMSSELFNQEIACLFTEYVGRVFKNFDEEIHLTDQGFRPDWETYACADYGFTNPFVWLVLQIDPHHERIHVLDEYYEVGKTTEEAAAEIQARGLAPRSIRAFYPDPAEPDRTRTISNMLQMKSASPGALEKKDRIEWIRRKLKIRREDLLLGHPERVPMLTFQRGRCPNTIREMNDYRYKETAEQASEKGRSAPEEPMKKDDHAPEALGRFFSGFFGRPFSTGPRQTRAHVGRRG
jgi:hypothetical protein